MSIVRLIAIASLKGSILLLLALIVTRSGVFQRRTSAAARHLTWVAALAGMLLMPLLALVVPPLAIVPNVRITPPTATVSAPDAPGVRVPTLTPATPAYTPAPAPSETHIDWSRALPLAWAILAALLFLRLLHSWARVASWARRARSVDDGRWLTLVQRLAMRVGITRPVILLRSERACVPMTWGVVYPRVLLPIDADDWNEERRTIVLLHELAHVKRLDAFTQLVAQLAIAVFWFNPLVWLAAREMRKEREHACDDFVLQGGARASDYAHDLLQIARSLGSSSAPAAAALAMARRSEFEGRLLAILDPKTDRRAVTRARMALASAGVIVLALPLAALAPAKSTSALPKETTHAAMQPIAHLDSASTTLEREIARIVGPRPRSAQRTPSPSEQQPTQAPSVKQPPPDRETLISVARAASKMTSDYEKAELLLTIAKYYMPDDELRTIYLDAVSTMTSDYDRGRTLYPLLATDKSLPPKAVAQVTKIAGSMTSDYEKANLIIRVVTEARELWPETRAALISALSTLTSDYDRHRAITAIVKRGELNADDATAMINATIPMTGSYEKANALIEIATKYGLNDAGVRKAYFKAAETITAADDYRRAMAGVIK